MKGRINKPILSFFLQNVIEVDTYRQIKIQKPVLFCKNALQNIIGGFRVLHSDWLNNLRSYNSSAYSDHKKIVYKETSDGWSTYNCLMLEIRIRLTIAMPGGNFKHYLIFFFGHTMS